ncbi:N-acetylmuramic acid 6-phosphate etherase [Microbacterium sp. YY-01]|uniref:N-acetylmuramic acid 6-phosphate etherase n=1 Tax=Microbacterium sp. YY-01 TaxID=3421634 RepID=UPI003D16AA60
MNRSDELRADLESLATERIDPQLSTFDAWSVLEQVDLMTEHTAHVATAVAAQRNTIAQAVEAIAHRRAQGGRLIYVGAGTAGRMGVLDASEIPPTFGTDPSEVLGLIAGGDYALRHAVENAEDDTDAARKALAEVGVTAHDAVVGISASGRTPFVVAALDYAREHGALAVAVACNTDSVIAAHADVAIEVEVGPEAIAGSTRLKAGTAQKTVLNMLSTLVMVREGKVFGNLMVDVQSTNAKLRARAESIVMTGAGCNAATAVAALSAAAGDVKSAIVVAARGVSAAQAQELLDQYHGHLRNALESGSSAT